MFNNCPTRCDCIQFITFLQTALRVSGVDTHHQELLNCNYSSWHLSTGSTTIRERMVVDSELLMMGVNIRNIRAVYLLTPWCRVLLEELNGLQLVKKIPAYYGTRSFITALTSVRQTNLVHITTSHLLEIHPNIIHPSTKCLTSSPFVFCVMPPLETPPWRSEWGSSLPPDCFVSRGSTLHVSVSKQGCFAGRGFSPSPKPQAGGPPLVGCSRLLIQFIRSYPPYRRSFLYPQPEDAPCRGDRDPLHG